MVLERRKILTKDKYTFLLTYMLFNFRCHVNLIVSKLAKTNNTREATFER